MTWRSVVISRAATLRFHNQRLVISQPPNEASVPLEDIAVLLLDSAEILLTSRMLQECVDAGIVVLTTGANHHPNGCLLPFLPHSRPLKMVQRQLLASVPQKKRIWQSIIQQKIRNQSLCLEFSNKPSVSLLRSMVNRVKSGDPNNLEANAARAYFQSLFGTKFKRSKDCLLNSALNYGYAIFRAAIARSLALFGFLPVIGIHHCNEQNAFNLADDLLEPFRPLVDLCVAHHFSGRAQQDELLTDDKAHLINLLHHEVRLGKDTFSALAAIETCVISLGQYLDKTSNNLKLPELIPLNLHRHE